MQLNNVKGKYIAAIFQEGKKVIGHLPLRKSGMFAQTIFYFLKAAKENRWQITVHGRAINQNDGMGIKVPSQFLFTAEEKFNFQNSIFSKKHSLNYCNYIVKEPKTKKLKPTISSICPTTHLMLQNFQWSILWQNIMPFH